jgi:hypothetical protein
MTDLIEHLLNSFENAQEEKSKVSDEILEMEGYSGSRTRHFYNNILSMPDARYLEVGTWKGSTVCAAMNGNSANVVCIDNWSQFPGPSGESIKEVFLTNFNKYRGKNDATFLEGDCFSINTDLIPKRNIYLYDGEHSYESHYNALKYYLDCMDDQFIFLCDDWTWDVVRLATTDAMRDLKLKVLYQNEIRYERERVVAKEYAKAMWWNGIYFAVLQKPKFNVGNSNKY